MILLFALLGCSEPKTLADCAGVRDAAEREECRFQMVRPLLPDPNDPKPDYKALKKGLDAALAAIDDPRSRDLLLLRLAIASPSTAGFLCNKVETDGARQKCQQVLGRPHLGTVRKAPEAPSSGEAAPSRPATAGPSPSEGR